ncbi:MAG TPA: hypothetical protein VFI66_07170 [Gemmatimonadales bacterium]|nr:hypothetical protein [Gemmatimonadales bacterium]
MPGHRQDFGPRQIYAKVVPPSIVPTEFNGVRIGLNFTRPGRAP